MHIIILGGGAAGVFAAITAATTNPAAQVLVLERSPQLLGKVRISGGGRCNVTPACFDPAELVKFYPRGGAALRGPFTRFQPRDMVDWFAQRGVWLKTEPDGRMFPTTDDSQTIVDCLLKAAEEAGVRLWTGVRTQEIERVPASAPAPATEPTPDSAPVYTPPGFRLHLQTGKTLHADRLLLATGSSAQGWDWAVEMGHTLEAPVPSLFTFEVPDEALRALAGVSVPIAALQLQVGSETFRQQGPVLVTHWGLSGPAVLKLSAWGARALHDRQYQAALTVNWLPALPEAALREQLLAAKITLARRKVVSEPVGGLPQRLWELLTQRCQLEADRRWADLSKAQLAALARELHHSAWPVQGKGVFKDEFVTCGGVRLNEVNFKTMESRVCPHLYFAGEILDIDGLTGGYNFQSAWTTGWLAGQAMARA